MFDGNKVSSLNIPKWQHVYRADLAQGAYGIIAVHETSLGIALGGCRMWQYENEAEALTDALRLSRGMTFKNAIADLPLGGGKSVIVCDPEVSGQTREDILAEFGKFVAWVNAKKACYLTAEDMNTTVDDIHIVGRHTKYSCGNIIDPSPYTAWGVFAAIEHAVHYFADDLFDGNGSLAGKKIFVQGLGKVGTTLLGYLHDAGAKLYVSEPRKAALQAVVERYPDVDVLPTDETYLDLDLDVFAPCARGEVVTENNLDRVKYKVLCGAANNQLQNSSFGKSLHQQRTVYCPDYIANMGGVCSIQYVEFDKLSEADAMEKLKATVQSALDATFATAFKKDISFSKAVDEVVKAKVWGRPGSRNEVVNRELFAKAVARH